MGVKQVAAMSSVCALAATFVLATVIPAPDHAASDAFVQEHFQNLQALSADEYGTESSAYAEVGTGDDTVSEQGESSSSSAGAPKIPAGDHAAILNAVPNGSMPDDLLADLSFTTWPVYEGVADSFEAMNVAYKGDTGSDLAINNIYRPGFQGRSFHGWGLAVDFNGPNGTLDWGDAQFAWLMEHGPEYGFYLPMWAGRGGSNPEPWHWEFGSYYGLGAGDCASACPKNRQLWVMD